MAPPFEYRVFDLDRLELVPGTLSSDEQARVVRKATPVLRQRQAASFHAVRSTLAPLLGQMPSALVIAIADGGKPFLPRHPLRFNMSHSDGVGLLAWGAVEIGADVEARIARPRDALARKILGDDEWDLWRDVPEPSRAEWLTRAWTRKEAVLKAAGTGLRVPAASVDVRGGEGEGRERAVALGDRRWRCIDLGNDVPDGYLAAVCVAVDAD